MSFESSNNQTQGDKSSNSDQAIVITTDKETSNLDQSIDEAALNMALFALDEEKRREQSLLSQSGWMITSFSALSIVVATLLSNLYFKHQLGAHHCYITITTFFLVVFISFLLAVIAQWRGKQVYPQSPQASYSYFADNKESFNQEGITKTQCDLYESIHQSILKNNNRRKQLLNISTILFIVAIGELLLFLFLPEIYFLLLK